jgi:hypothetical protein
MTLWDEFYRVAFRKRLYRTIDELQSDLDAWLVDYNQARQTTDAAATARRRCRPFLTHSRSQSLSRSESAVPTRRNVIARGLLAGLTESQQKPEIKHSRNA